MSEPRPFKAAVEALNKVLAAQAENDRKSTNMNIHTQGLIDRAVTTLKELGMECTPECEELLPRSVCTAISLPGIPKTAWVVHGVAHTDESTGLVQYELAVDHNCIELKGADHPTFIYIPYMADSAARAEEFEERFTTFVHRLVAYYTSDFAEAHDGMHLGGDESPCQ